MDGGFFVKAVWGYFGERLFFRCGISSWICWADVEIVIYVCSGSTCIYEINRYANSFNFMTVPTAESSEIISLHVYLPIAVNTPMKIMRTFRNRIQSAFTSALWQIAIYNVMVIFLYSWYIESNLVWKTEQCIPLCVLLRLRSYKWNCLRVSLNYSGW